MTNKNIVLQYYEEIGKGNYDAYDQYCTQDFEDITSHGHVKGLQNAKHASMGMHSCFSDIGFKIEDALEEGNRVAVRGIIKGTQISPFFGMPNHGKSFLISFIAIYNLNNENKITHRYVNGDDQGMAKQLGWF